MARKRLTRQDSRGQTAERLLAAARRLIARRGLNAVSVENIAAAAGYTRGAFYSNFDDKEDLFIELLRRDYEETSLDLDALCDNSVPLENLQRRFLEAYGRIYGSADVLVNWAEARMLAARDPPFRARLNDLIEPKRGEVAAFIQYAFRRIGKSPPLPPATLAIGFMSLYETAQLNTLSSSGQVSLDTPDFMLTAFIMDSIIGVATPRSATSFEPL
jgi:AcrR family transcriptional regulator